MQSAKFAWSWLCLWLLTNISRANLVALCRSISVYILGGLETRVGVWAGAKTWVKVGAKASAKIETQKIAGVGVGTSLPLIKALKAFPASLCLLVEGKLW